jgi:hypothetical protein
MLRMSDASTTQRLLGLFSKTPVMRMPEIERAIGQRSRRSLFRDLASIGYLSSYTHTGRYYTLRSLANFDNDGLWLFNGIGFSRDGTLKATVRRLVDSSTAGRTQQELRLRLGVRVHNPLLELVESQELARESIHGEYVYVTPAKRRAAAQLVRRQELVAKSASAVTPPTPLSLEVEVLSEAIHGSVVGLDPEEIAARLVARGVAVATTQVEEVFRRHGVVKKTARSPFPRSRR